MNARTMLHSASLKPDQLERLVTDVELANRLSISRRHVHVLRARGQLRAVRLGNAVRFPLNENLARVLGSFDDDARGRGGA
jgi:excisionase family DNA binding protein